MLNGLEPIIIFNFKKIITTAAPSVNGIPAAAAESSIVTLPVIPLYLSDKLTGVFIDTEDKSIDIDTSFESSPNSGDTVVNQRPISSSVKINMLARKDSIGLALFSALAELIFPKVTSKEYSITYLHGAVTVFDGIIKSFSIQQQANTDLSEISLEIMKPPKQKSSLEVTKGAGIPLGAPVI